MSSGRTAWRREARPTPRSFALALALCLSGCMSVELFGGVPGPLREEVLSGSVGPKILLLKIDGLLTLQAPVGDIISPVRDSPVSRVREELDRARRDDEVKALVLRIDSPGGSATASDVTFREILRFKQERGVPVVAHLVGTATSGGYYVAMAADHVVAHPTTITGSIGVIFLGVNVVGLMEKLGIENQTLVSGPHKDAGSPLRRLTGSERRQLQAVLDDLHARFERVVDQGRPGLDRAEVAKLADGRIFTASQARERGLVDEMGDLEGAIRVARQRIGAEKVRVVSYHRSREYENNFYTAAPKAPTLRLELPAPFSWLGRPGFYYVWPPGLQ